MAAKAFGVSELNIDDINIKASNGSITASITGSAVKSTNSTGLISEDTGYSSLQEITAEELPNRGFGSGNTNAGPSEFGWSFSISEDNSTIAIADRGYNETTFDQGKIYIYSKNSNSSTYNNNDYTSSVETIVGLVTARVGDQVTLNSDGTYLTTKEVKDEGNQYVGVSDNVLSLYHRNNNSWSLVGVSSFATSNAKTVFNPRDESLIYDGRHTPDTQGTFYGEIRVYDSSNLTGVGTITFTNTGNITQANYIKVTTNGTGNYIGFGKKFAVANINTSGSTYTDRIIAGVPNATIGSSPWAGGVAIFDKSTSSNTWTQVATIEPPVVSAGSFFGLDVASSVDGKTIIVSSGYPVHNTGTGVWDIGEKLFVYVYKNVLNSNGYVSTNYVLDQTLEVELGNSVGTVTNTSIWTSISCTSDANRIVINGQRRGTTTYDRDTADVFDRAGPDSLYVKTTEWTHTNGEPYAAVSQTHSIWGYDQQHMQISKDGSIGMFSDFRTFYYQNFGNSTYGYVEIFNLDSGSLPTADQVLKTNASGADIYINGNSVSKIEQISTAGVSAGGTITMDLSNANNYELTLDNNYILGNPINIVPGQSGFISIAQTAGGGKTVGWGTYWDFADGIAPTLTFDANDVNLLGYYVRSTTSIVADIVSDIG